MRTPRRTTLDLRVTLAAYAGLVVLVLALLPVDRAQRLPLAFVAAGLFAVVAALVAWADLRPDRRMPGVVGILVYLVAVALLRETTGGGGGYGALVLLPIIWASVRRRRPELVLGLAGAAIVLITPLVVVGSPTYPPSGWRSAAVTLFVAIVIGGRVTRLVRGLRDAVDHSTAILETMSEGYGLIVDGRIVTVNPALCEITGLHEDQLIGSTAPYPFWAPELRAETEETLRRIVQAGGGEFELTLMRADGVRFPASITATAVPTTDGRRVFLNTIRDITARRAHEEAMLRRADELVAIAEVTRALSHSDPQDVRRTICEVAMDVAAATSATIWEAGADGVLRSTCMLGAPAPDFTLGPEQQGNGAVVAMRNGRPLFVADAATSSRCDPRMLALLGAASAHFQPIQSADGPRGVLTMSWKEPLAALPTHAALLLEVLAAEAAAALDRNDLVNRLEELTRTDDLTGLPNRRAWDERLEQELGRARRTGQPVAVAMLDLDFFKDYNDRYGHLAGDNILRTAARLWQADLRDSDVLARWGGEEFALLLPDCEMGYAQDLVERLRGLLPDGVTFSAGVCAYDDADPSRNLVEGADRALYDAKRNGRDRVQPAVGVRG